MSAKGQIIICLLIFGFLIYKGYKFLKELVAEEHTSKRNKVQLEKQLSEIRNRPVTPIENKKTVRCLSHDEIKRHAAECRPHWRWMTLAGGTDPLLMPRVYYKDNTIYLVKEGYDLWLENWKAYRNGKVWEERAAALDRFMVDLLGKYSDKLDVLQANPRYIADDLIEIKDTTKYSSDFVITMPFYIGSLYSVEDKNFFTQELKNTPIFDDEIKKID